MVFRTLKHIGLYYKFTLTWDVMGILYRFVASKLASCLNEINIGKHRRYVSQSAK